MNAKRFWCAVCNKMVEVVIEEGTSALIAPIIGGTAGGAIGKARGGPQSALAGTLLGALAGIAVHAMIPKAQRVVCPDCCSHLA